MQEIIEYNHDFGSQIIVVERETWIKKQVTYVLQNVGYKVMGIADSQIIPLLIGSRLKLRVSFDLVILANINSSTDSTDCLQICRRLRFQDKLMPIIFVSNRESEIDLILTLEMGADTYLTKPINSRELIVRCRNLIRRYRGLWPKNFCLSFRDIQLYQQKCLVTVRGKEVAFTPNEFFLLNMMMQDPCRVWTRKELCQKIWGLYSSRNVQRLTVLICYLRKKIELNPSQPEYLITANGIGYRFG